MFPHKEGNHDQLVYFSNHPDHAGAKERETRCPGLCLRKLHEAKRIEDQLSNSQKDVPDFATDDCAQVYDDDARLVFAITDEKLCRRIGCVGKLFIPCKIRASAAGMVYYVLMIKQDELLRFAGYVSVANHGSACDRNGSCFLILPRYQHSGNGQFLFAFTYALKPGSPEKPFSSHGFAAFDKFW